MSRYKVLEDSLQATDITRNKILKRLRPSFICLMKILEETRREGTTPENDPAAFIIAWLDVNVETFTSTSEEGPFLLA
jgi:hypothetical protein